MVRHIEGPKLLILDSYPLHEEFAAKFAENNTHVLFVPKGLAWSLQPLDCGYLKFSKTILRGNGLKHKIQYLLMNKRREHL